jgi:hypothetical protein
MHQKFLEQLNRCATKPLRGCSLEISGNEKVEGESEFKSEFIGHFQYTKVKSDDVQQKFECQVSIHSK